MKRPFPVRRSSTLTRTNIELFVMDYEKEHGEKPDAATVAKGVTGLHGEMSVRHVARAKSLMPKV